MPKPERKEDELIQHYLGEDFDPVLPSNVGFRHFRFRIKGGGWRRVQHKITSKDDLVKWIAKLGGVDIYYSTSTWLNPGRISSKGGSGTYHVADNCLLGNDLVFDIDAEEPITQESLNEARKSANNIYEAMKQFEDEYKLEYVSFTGLKGFRLSYTDTHLELPEDPRKRFDYVEKKRKIFIGELLRIIEESKSKGLPGFYKNAKTIFDEKVTTNIMCVVRVLGTGHSRTGFISSKILPSSLKKPISKILNEIPFIGKKRPGIPVKREMTRDNPERVPRPRPVPQETDVTGLASTPPFKYFVSNRVLGVRRAYIPVFIYQDHQKYLEDVKDLQVKHKLGDLYIFREQDTHNVVVISLKSMQRKQLQKVLNASKSRSKYDFLKYKKIWIPLFMDFQEKIKGKVTGHLSRSHFHYVNPNKEIKSKGL